MKRAIVMLCVAALLVGFSLSHEVLAGKGPAEKVAICHVTDSAPDGPGKTYVVGHVIMVSENAREAHLAHGDVENFFEYSEANAPFLESLGLNVSGVDCMALIID
jgi:hypothetical protein